MSMVVHHVSLGSNNMEKALTFYDATLATLGLKRILDFAPHAVGYGTDAPLFWIQMPYDRQTASVGNGVHIAFAATMAGRGRAPITVPTIMAPSCATPTATRSKPA